MPSDVETWYAQAVSEWRMLRRVEYPYAFADDVVVRYIDLEDPRDLETKVNYLYALTGITDLKVQDEAFSGAWDTHSAGYQVLVPDKPRAGTLRLWHAMRRPADTSSVSFLVTEDNCTYKVSLAFRWRRATIATPSTGTSGITYTVQGVNVDRETGLYNYIIEKREQYTTYVKEYVVSETKYSTIYEQKFYGVRKDANGIYQLDHLGNTPAGWYNTGTDIQGTTYTVGVSKNDNCTADVTQRKEVAKLDVTEAVQRERTVFGDTETVTIRNQLTAVNAYVTVADGVVKIQSSKLNDDGTFNNTKITKTAIPSDAIVTKERTAFSDFVSTTLRNQPEAVNDFVSVIGGVITRRMSTKNEDGTYDNTEETRTAIAAEAVVMRSQTIFSQIVSITNRNQPEAVNAFVAVTGGVITIRTSKKNDDGTFDNTEETRTAVSRTAKITSTATQFRASVTTVMSGQATAVNELVTASGGVVYTRSSELEENGTYTNSEQIATETGVASALRFVRQTAFEIFTRVINRHQVAATPDPTTDGATVTNEKTDGVLIDQTNETITPRAVSSAVTSNSGDFFESGSRLQHRNQTAADTTPTGLINGATGNAKITTVTNRLTEQSRYDVEKAEETPAPAWVDSITFTGDKRTITVYLFTNMTKGALQTLATSLGTVSSVNVAARANRYGLLDGSIYGTVDDDSTSWWTQNPYEVAVIEYERLASGEILQLEGTMKFGQNVSDGASEFYGSPASYRQYSWFHDVGHNWYMYKKITSVTPFVEV